MPDAPATVLRRRGIDQRERWTTTARIDRHPEHPAVKKFVTLFASPRPREELYDSEADPWQLNNIADSPAHAAVKARLKAQLEAYQRQTRDPRITGDMKIFDETRAFVNQRKYGAGGYGEK